VTCLKKVGVGFTYLSRVENERPNFGDDPSDALIHRLAAALEADEEEVLLLAERLPEPVKKRVLQRPDAFNWGVRSDRRSAMWFPLSKSQGKSDVTTDLRQTLDPRSDASPELSGHRQSFSRPGAATLRMTQH
jgi:transcriptional regulator with XRE-family HTH domain